ncbi:MAG: hypothetical protein ACPGVU_19730, partial [Limisphaerales bacterium]
MAADLKVAVGAPVASQASAGGIFRVTGKVIHNKPRASTSGFYTVKSGYWSLVQAVQAHGAPPLHVERIGNQVRLYLARESGAFQLETSSGIGPNASWTVVSALPSDTGF